jgi:probable HAF family extracellular repeat protein
MQSQNIRALRLFAAGLMTGSLVACFQAQNTNLPPSPSSMAGAHRSASRTDGIRQGAKPPRYTIVDLGTLGGTTSGAGGLNNRGWVAGISTLAGDYTAHAFLWRNGKMTDVGSDGQPNSFTSESAPVNDEGAVTGYLDTATPDPQGEDFCGVGDHNICLPFLWHNGTMSVLPLPGGNNAEAFQISDEGQIAGVGETGVVDPNCQSPQVYDLVATVWGPKKGALRTLPPYESDTEALANGTNDKGEVVGTSGNCALLSKSFGYIEAVLWRNGRPINLGNLGGGIFNIGFSINNKSEVTGQSEVTLYGAFHAFLWRRGIMKDLGTLPGDYVSLGNSINDSAQIVGLSFPYGSATVHGVLWQNGAVYDLNTLIPKHSDIDVLEALGINEHGQIAGYGFDRNTYDVRAYLATPCDAENPDHKGCQDARGASSSVALPENVRRTLMRWNAMHHIHWPTDVQRR